MYNVFEGIKETTDALQNKYEKIIDRLNAQIHVQNQMLELKDKFITILTSELSKYVDLTPEEE